MGKAMSNDTNNIIVRALAQGHSRNDIAKMCGVSTRAVTRVSTNLKKHGTARPPPSGLKQGRPAKMTRRQADALLAWITARNYTFYVKDLVSFLREHHGYQGCDGTVRRGMIRAGFKRKEPYHKSEITVWIPPDHSPQFEVIVDEEQQQNRQKKEKVKSDEQQLLQQPQYTLMSAPPMTPQHQAPAAPMTSSPPDSNNLLNSYSNYYHQDHVNFQTPQPVPPLDPHLYEMDQRTTSQPTPPVKSSAKRSRKPKKEEELQNQVSTMQDELAKQSELIRQLQMQLAQTQGQTPQDEPMEMVVSADSMEVEAQQMPSEVHEHDEEEVAV